MKYENIKRLKLSHLQISKAFGYKNVESFRCSSAHKRIMNGINEILNMKTLSLFLLLILFGCSEKEYSEPPKPKSFIIGSWMPRDTTMPRYIFEENGIGKQFSINHWYDITYTLKGQILVITFFGRSTQFWIYEESNSYFKMCTTSTNCIELDKK